MALIPKPMLNEKQGTKSFDYSAAIKVLKGERSYFSLCVRLSFVSNGGIELDPTTLHRIFTGAVEHPRSIYSQDKLLGLTLGLMFIALERSTDVSAIVMAGQLFLETHLGPISAELLLRDFLSLPHTGDDARSSMRRALRKMLQAFAPFTD